MLKLFDYAFYSLYDLYLRKEGAKSNPTLSASSATTTIQLCLFFAIAIIVDFFTEDHLSLHLFLGVSENMGKGIFLCFIALWLYRNYKDYQKRLDNIIKKYKNHPRNKWFRPWMLYIVALAFILVPIFLIKIFKFYGF